MQTVTPSRLADVRRGLIGIFSSPSTSTLATSLTVMAGGLLTGVMVARLVGVEGRGTYALLILGPSLIAHLGDLGLPIAYVYQASKGHLARVLVSNAIWLVPLQTICLVAIGGPLLALYLTANLSEWLIPGIVLLLLFLPVNLLTRYLISVYQGISRFGVFNSTRLLLALSQLALLALAMVFDLAAIGYLLAALVVSNLVALAYVLAKSKEFGWRFTRLDRSLARGSISHGWRAHLGSLAPTDVVQLDLALVAVFLSAYDAGLYTVALSAAAVVRTIGIVMALVLQPRIPQAADVHEVFSLASRALVTTAVLAGVLALAAALFARPLIAILYGHDFVEATTVVQVLACVAVLGALRMVVAAVLRGSGYPLASSAGEIVSLIVAAIMLTMLVPRMGLTGAGISMGAAYVSALMVSLTLASRLLIRAKKVHTSPAGVA
jgi:enterobacterial common antigen flippase